jgi:hypothetical protein
MLALSQDVVMIMRGHMVSWKRNITPNLTVVRVGGPASQETIPPRSLRFPSD